MSIELLRRLPLFSGLDDSDLDRLYSTANRVRLARGDLLMSEGEVADTAYVVIEGVFEVTKRAGERELVIARRGAGEIMGEIALLENAQRSATVRATTPAELLEISRATFQELLQKCPGAAVAVLQTVSTRLRNTETMLRQSEKMAALGTLSAGLAHELNNPAAAVQRIAGQLREAVEEIQRQTAVITRLSLTAEQVGRVERLRASLAGPRARDIDALARGDAEAELQDWLEEAGADGAWAVAAAISAAGCTVSDIARATAELDDEQRAGVAVWLAAVLSAQTLLAELSEGAARISEIVGAVKSYAYLDRGPVQLIDVHEGLENTLVILRHRLKHGVEIIREYDRGLPRIEAYGGELNQVWTNLIDNAVDAMQGEGVLRIRTARADPGHDGDRIAVTITDSGPGIPDDIQPKIFEAFFTTKEPGRGTGLGLHISYNIVVNQHLGDITVTSRPGEAAFRVVLPVRLKQRSGTDE